MLDLADSLYGFRTKMSVVYPRRSVNVYGDERMRLATLLLDRFN